MGVQTIDTLRADSDFCRDLMKWHTVPPHAARCVDFPEALYPKLKAALTKRGVSPFYTHQSEAIDEPATLIEE